MIQSLGNTNWVRQIKCTAFGLDSARGKSTEMTTQIAQSVPFDFP